MKFNLDNINFITFRGKDKEVLTNKLKEHEKEFSKSESLEMTLDDIYSSKRPRQGKFGFYAPDGKEKKIIKDSIMSILNERGIERDHYAKNKYKCIELEIHAYKKASDKLTKFEKCLIYFGFKRFIEKPDIDNIIKIYMDSMTGMFWEDDNIVTKVTAEKHLLVENIDNNHMDIKINFIGR